VRNRKTELILLIRHDSLIRRSVSGLAGFLSRLLLLLLLLAAAAEYYDAAM